MNQRERENEKHRSEFNSNFIPIVYTITKNKSKYDKIDVEKSKNLDDLNKTKNYEKININENNKRNYNSRFPQNYNNIHFSQVNKNKSFKGNYNGRKNEDKLFSNIDIPITVDNKNIENEDIIPRISTIHKKTDSGIKSNDNNFSGEKITENIENPIYKKKIVRGILKNELIIPPFTEINTFIIPEEQIEQEEVNLTAIPSLMIEKGVMAYNKRNVLKNEDGSFPITLSNLQNKEVTLENEFPITYLEFKEQNAMNKIAVITVNKETKVNEKEGEKYKTEPI